MTRRYQMGAMYGMLQDSDGRYGGRTMASRRQANCGI
jgi:hypothetical protein